MNSADIKRTKHCAFCKHWYDPTNECIRPKAPKMNLWEYDEKAERMCFLYNSKRPGFAFCRKYDGKIEVDCSSI